MANPVIDELFYQPMTVVVQNIKDVAPGLLIFIIVLLIGYLLAAFLGWVTRKVLAKINIDKRLRTMDLHDSLGKTSLAKVGSIIVKWYIFILFLNQGIVYLQLGRISEFINTIVAWLPKLIFAVLVIVMGLILIDFIINKLLSLKSHYIKLIANALKAILIVIVIFTAIEQLGIKTALAQNLFLLIVGTIMFTFSLAMGIGLGLGLKDEIKPFIRKYKKRFK